MYLTNVSTNVRTCGMHIHTDRLLTLRQIVGMGIPCTELQVEVCMTFGTHYSRVGQCTYKINYNNRAQKQV